MAEVQSHAKGVFVAAPNEGRGRLDRHLGEDALEDLIGGGEFGRRHHMEWALSSKHGRPNGSQRAEYGEPARRAMSAQDRLTDVFLLLRQPLGTVGIVGADVGL